MKPPVYSTSLSLHNIFRRVHPVLRDWSKSLPYVQPCYAVSDKSTQQTIMLMRSHRIPMICDTPGQVRAVNDYSLTLEGHRFGNNEYIARDILSCNSTTSYPMWVYTKISHDGVENTRKMFEHIWAHKYILNGIVFDTRNFADTQRGSISPSMYSYKIAIDYLFRNIVQPFENEYGIQTPCIMMDARDHVRRIDQLYELDTHIHESTKKLNGIHLRLVVGPLFDAWHE